VAKFFHRADVALRLIRQANERAEIDKCGIEPPGIASPDKLCGVPPEFFATDCEIDRDANVEQASEHTRAIRFDNWDRLIESKCRDRVRRVAANAGQPANRRDIAGQDPPMPILHNRRGDVEIARAVVIAKALPGVEDIMLRSACQ